MTSARDLGRLAAVALAASSTLGAAPALEITGLPTYAVDGFLDGVVSGADPASHHVAVYIQIEGAGWWTKPTSAMPTVAIQGDGTFEADVATGGLDNRATIFCAALLPAALTPPLAEGAPRIPASLDPLALDCETRYGRTLGFAGRTWGVKESPEPVGPGGNRFSDRGQDVFVEDGRLHLRLDLSDGHWRSAEVVLTESLGFGTYAFQTSSELDDLDVNATFGAFTWDPFGDGEKVPAAPHREIDFEDSRWGDAADPTNAQMVVQPHDLPGNLHRYTLPDLAGDAALTRFFRWEPCRVEFAALRGHHDPSGFPVEDVIETQTYAVNETAGHAVPGEGREGFRFNLWLNGGASAPAGGQAVEVVIDDFSFTPLPEPGGSLPLLAGCGVLAVLARRRRRSQSRAIR